MRIGNVNPEAARQAAPVDLAQPARPGAARAIGIDHPDVRFEIVYGVSGNKRAWYDNSNATRLGYRPQDNSEKYAEECWRRRSRAAIRSPRLYQGGIFTVAEEVPNPAAAPKARSEEMKITVA